MSLQVITILTLWFRIANEQYQIHVNVLVQFLLQMMVIIKKKY